jgi:TPR repeat protein
MKVGTPSPVPVVGADHMVPKQENDRQLPQNLNILSTHYVAPKTHQELRSLKLGDRQSDIYGHVFGTNSSDNDDCRRRVGNAHTALLRMLDRPDLRQAQDVKDVQASLTRRFAQLRQAATRGYAVQNDLAKIASRGQTTKFVVTKLIQAAAVTENALELDIGINWRLKVKPRDGSEMIKQDASLGRTLNTKAFENLPLAFAGTCVATQALSLAHDWIQPAYFTSIGAKRRDLAAAAEEFRADSERAASMRAGGRAAQAIVETYGERGRDFLESAMNEVDRSVYDYMQALQRQVPRAMPPDEQFARTGVTSAALQATYARLEEARFINTFTERGRDRAAVVEAWRPAEDLPGAGVLLRAKILPSENLDSAARVRYDLSAEDPSCAEADPPRWNYMPDLSTALAELGRTAGNITGWGDYLRIQKDLPSARKGNAEALARLGELCEDGRAGKARGPAANRMAQPLYEVAAAGGNAQGQYRLGRMYARGQASGPEGESNDPAAVQWLTRAAEQQHAEAQAELGVLHVSGRTGLDPRSAAIQGRRWCERAVGAGVRSAELFFALGSLYDESRVEGISEERRMDRCKTFYAEAADEGHVESQRRLGLLHLNGDLPPETDHGNDAVAARYLRMAAAQNDAVAAWHLAEMYREGRVMPTEDEGTAHQAMLRYLGIAADEGHAPAHVALGVLHERGRAASGTSEPDYPRAAWHYRKAATQGHMEAQFELARLLMKKLAPPDRGQEREAEAVHWCTLAAEQGCLPAQVVLSSLYEAGQAGVSPGPLANQKMAEWLERAAEQGLPDLQYRLAEHYFNGTAGLATGDEALRIAAKWYERAAAQAHAPARYRLGVLHAEGKAGIAEGDEADAQAVALWTQAAEAGHGPAMLELAGMYAEGRAVPPAGQQAGAIAARWYGSVAALDRAPPQVRAQALHELARLHEQGRTGLDVNAAQAAALESYRLAAQSGHEPAERRLMELQRSAHTQAEPADETAQGTGPAHRTGDAIQEPPNAPHQTRQVHRGVDLRPEAAAASTSAGKSAEVHAMKAAVRSPEQAKFEQGKALATDGKGAAEVARGYRLMEDAAAQGDPDLLFELAMLYIEGAQDKRPGPRRAMKISSLLTQAADQNHLAAMQMLARLCLNEQYVDSATGRTLEGPEADRAAQGYLEKCIELGDTHSSDTLVWMYEAGRAVPPIRGKAMGGNRKAARAGNDRARQELDAE